MNARIVAITMLSALFSAFSNWANAQDFIVIYPTVCAVQSTPSNSGGTSKFQLDAAAIVEGRVIENKNHIDPKANDRKRDNLRRNLGLMINNERKHYSITVQAGSQEWQTQTDQEGYFRIEITDLAEFSPGWHSISAHTAEANGKGDLLIVPSDNVHGVISDVDDTIQITEINSKSRMLKNTLLKNPLQRQAVPGVSLFYKKLAERNPHPDTTPILYLSASPRQLHTAIEAFLTHNDFPRGVLITKRVTDDKSSEPIFDQAAYKTKKIEQLLARLPHIKFTLVGDDGEQDPETYADIQQRFPDRVDAIWIRHVNPDPKRARIAGQGVLNDELKTYLSTANVQQ